eukprot:gene13332-biopygen1842
MKLRRVEEGTIAHRDGGLRGCLGMLGTHANDAPIGRRQKCGRESRQDPGRFERLWSRCTTLKLRLRPEGASELSLRKHRESGTFQQLENSRDGHESSKGPRSPTSPTSQLAADRWTQM